MQNVQGLTGKDKRLNSLVDTLVDLMITNNIMVYFIQETWIVGSRGKLVREHMVFQHNREERIIGFKGKIPGRVAIILSSKAVEVWRAVRLKPPIMTPMDSPFIGRFIGVKLSFPQINQYEKQVQGNTTIFVASVYRPVDKFEHIDFIDILSFIMSSVPKTAKFIGGHDVNANLGTRSKMYRKTLYPWGIYNRNIKVGILLGLFSHNQLKISNRFFKKPSFVTWRSFRKMRSPHMLDVISVSENFFKCVRNCGAFKKGMRSDHSALRVDLMNQSIEYKTKFTKIPVIDWKSIKERDKFNEYFNVNLSNRLLEPFKYTDFN